MTGTQAENPSMRSCTLFHNPRCSKSRAALEILREYGIEPRIIEYLTFPPDLDTLRSLHAALGRPAREMLRSDSPEYLALQLDDPSCPDSRILEAIAAHPHLLQRPIVKVGTDAVIGRPPEAVLEWVASLPSQDAT